MPRAQAAIVCQDDQRSPVVVLVDADADTETIRDRIEDRGWDTLASARVLTLRQAYAEMAAPQGTTAQAGPRGTLNTGREAAYIVREDID